MAEAGQQQPPARVHVRLAELPREAGAVIAIQRAGYASEADLIGVAALPPQHESPGDLAPGATWVAELDGRIAGVMGFEEAEEPLIAKLAVIPQHARRGIGRALVRSAIDLAGERPLRVGTAAANAPALALYRSLGFEVAGEREVGDGIAFLDLRRPAPTEAGSAGS